MERLISAAEWDAYTDIIFAELAKMEDPAYLSSPIQMQETLQKFYSVKANVKRTISQLQLIRLTAEERRYQKVLQDLEDMLRKMIDETARDLSNTSAASEGEYEQQRVDSQSGGSRQIAEPPITTRSEGQPAELHHLRSSTPYAVRYQEGARNRRREGPKGETPLHHHWGPGLGEVQSGEAKDHQPPRPGMTERARARRAYDPPPQPHFADGAYPGQFLEEFEDCAAGAHIPVASWPLVIQECLAGRQRR